MPTQRQCILDYLRAHPVGADDDELAVACNIPQRQTANRICRELERQGQVRRSNPDLGKIVNTLVASQR